MVINVTVNSGYNGSLYRRNSPILRNGHPFNRNSLHNITDILEFANVRLDMNAFRLLVPNVGEYIMNRADTGHLELSELVWYEVGANQGAAIIQNLSSRFSVESSHGLLYPTTQFSIPKPGLLPTHLIRLSRH